MKRFLLFLSAFLSFTFLGMPDIHTLSLEEKIGQLIIVAAVSNEARNSSFMTRSPYTMDKEYIANLITNYHIGGVIFMGTGDPEEQIALIQKYQSMTDIPLLITQDLEWGLSMRLNPALRLPRAMTLGALTNEDDQLIYTMGKEIGKQCKTLGVHMNLAPVVDVNNNPKNPVINDRSFGQDPQRVTEKAILYLQGMQDAAVLTCAKHFPGHGDTDIDSHLTLPIIKHDKDRFNDIELKPFKKLIQHGVDAIMIAHLHAPALDEAHIPATFSTKIVTGLLRNELGFNGLIITDGLGMQALTNTYSSGEIEIKALQAGCDILLCPVDVPLAIEAIKQAILHGELLEKDIDDRVARIFAVKEKLLYTPSHRPLFSDTARSLKKSLYHAAITRTGNTQQFNPSTTYPIITIGSQEETFFYKTIKKYLSLSPFYIPQVISSQTIEHIVNSTENDQTIIIAIHSMNRSAINAFGMNSVYQTGYGIAPSTIELIEKLQQKNKNITLILFGNPYSTAYFSKNTDIIVAYEDDEDAQEGAALVIARTLKARGILPVHL